jgi:hypothetical protein
MKCEQAKTRPAQLVEKIRQQNCLAQCGGSEGLKESSLNSQNET